MNFMFDLEDASDDGAIDAAEFAIVCSSYGLDTAECEEAFGKMSQVTNQRGILNPLRFSLRIYVNLYSMTGSRRSY
jgi:hypothetical protein